MTEILETVYLRYERSDQVERDETHLSLPCVDSKICIFPSPRVSQLFFFIYFLPEL